MFFLMILGIRDIFKCKTNRTLDFYSFSMYVRISSLIEYNICFRLYNQKNLQPIVSMGRPNFMNGTIALLAFS